jgi:large subunit ribosomal protein L10
VNRTQKQELVAEVNGMLSDAGVVVVTHYKGLTVAEMSDLRGRLRAVGAGLKVNKNLLTKLSVKDTKYNNIADLLKGPTAIAYSADPVAAAKAIVDYAKTNEKLVIVGGAFGEAKLDVAGVKNLATMPSLDELRAKIIGMINTPATRIAGILQAPGGQIARVLGAYAAK